MSDIRVTITAIDRVTPELHRARYRFLTPVGRNIPPKGTIARQWLELAVAFRRVGRAFVRDMPYANRIPWAEVGRVWGLRLERLGTVYLLVAVVVLVVLIARTLLA